MSETTRRSVGVVGALLLVVVVALLLGSRDGGITLALPDQGQVSAAAVEDVPVFVVHGADGDVSVLDARSPHDVFPKVLAWCGPAGVFEDLWHGSLFDSAGRWIGGPAPTDMASFEVLDRSAGQIRVGARQPAAGRTVDSLDRGEPAGPRCAFRTALSGTDQPIHPGILDDLIVHDDVDRFPVQLWFPTPARVLGDVPGRP